MGEILQRSRASVGKAIPATLAAVPAADMVSDTEVADPVCGMRVQVSGARYISEYEARPLPSAVRAARSVSTASQRNMVLGYHHDAEEPSASRCVYSRMECGI
jgi:hypothetical protein